MGGMMFCLVGCEMCEWGLENSKEIVLKLSMRMADTLISIGAQRQSMSRSELFHQSVDQ